MSEVKVRECDVPECRVTGPSVATFNIRKNGLFSGFDLCPAHAEPFDATIAGLGGWRARGTAERIRLAKPSARASGDAV